MRINTIKNNGLIFYNWRNIDMNSSLTCNTVCGLDNVFISTLLNAGRNPSKNEKRTKDNIWADAKSTPC